MKTKNYDMFKFREDNREKIDLNHVQRIKNSIENRNLLEVRPIIVNESMEVLDGQHRLLAAKELQVDIYYEVQKKFESHDIILLNVSKKWNFSDYLNYYCKNGFNEYLKLRDFTKKNNFTIQVAVDLTMGRSKNAISDFKLGKYVFKDTNVSNKAELYHKTIEMIHNLTGVQTYTKSAKFWRALTRLFTNEEFEQRIWFMNLSKLTGKFRILARASDYIELFEEVYNYKQHTKLIINQD